MAYALVIRERSVAVTRGGLGCERSTYIKDDETSWTRVTQVTITIVEGKMVGGGNESSERKDDCDNANDGKPHG